MILYWILRKNIHRLNKRHNSLYYVKIQGNKTQKTYIIQAKFPNLCRLIMRLDNIYYIMYINELFLINKKYLIYNPVNVY